jgi:hypothetical protein
VGAGETTILVVVEASLRYHSLCVDFLTGFHEAGDRTVAGGEFDWGGRLLKCNGGVQRFPQTEWKTVAECKGIRELDCETYKSSRYESRA